MYSCSSVSELRRQPGGGYSGPTVNGSSSLRLISYFHSATQTKAHVISQSYHPPPLVAVHDTLGTLCVTQIGNEISSYHDYSASYVLIFSFYYF